MYASVEAPYIDTSYLEDLSDMELIARSKLGNDDALGVLLRRHSDALYRFCLHLMPNREDAEDICQETLARAMTRVHSLQTSGAFRSWLFSIARNLSIDSHRSRKRLCPMPDEDITPLPLYQEAPHERIEEAEEYQTVAEALKKLAQSHQTVLMLREIEGLSYMEIAQRLDISQSAVETLLFRARRRLREEYGRKSAPIPAFGILSHLRGLLSRFAAPLTGGAPLAAKIAITGFVLGGAALTAPHVLTAKPAFGASSPVLVAAGNAPRLDTIGASRHGLDLAPLTRSGASRHGRSGPAQRTSRSHGVKSGTASTRSSRRLGSSETKLTHMKGHHGNPTVKSTKTGIASVWPPTSKGGGTAGSAPATGHPSTTGGTTAGSSSQSSGSTGAASGRPQGSGSPRTPVGATSGSAPGPSSSGGVTSASQSPATGSTATTAAGQVQSTASGAASQVQSTASGATSQVQSTASGATSQVQSTASGTTSQVQSTASGATSQVQGTASGAAGQVEGSTTQASGQAQATASGAAGAASGATHSLPTPPVPTPTPRVSLPAPKLPGKP